MFASSREIRMMKRDFERTLLSPEACHITIQYYTPTGAADGELNPTPIQVDDVPCMQHIVKARDLQALKEKIIEVGDCIFYFSVNKNLNEPSLGNPVAEGTLKFIDSSGLIWSPKTIDQGEASRFLTFHVMDMQIGQAVICGYEK